jgi:hypothetical protein
MCVNKLRRRNIQMPKIGLTMSQKLPHGGWKQQYRNKSISSAPPTPLRLDGPQPGRSSEAPKPRLIRKIVQNFSDTWGDTIKHNYSYAFRSTKPQEQPELKLFFTTASTLLSNDLHQSWKLFTSLLGERCCRPTLARI